MLKKPAGQKRKATEEKDEMAEVVEYTKGQRVKLVLNFSKYAIGEEGVIRADRVGDKAIVVRMDGSDLDISVMPRYLELIVPPATKKKRVEYVEDADGVAWITSEPAKYCDWEIVQADIQFGVKCVKVDVLRSDSEFLTTLIDCAVKEGTSRITIPDGTFPTRRLMKLAMESLLPGFGSTCNVVSSRECAQWIQAAAALDVYSNPFMDQIRHVLLTNEDGFAPDKRTLPIPEMLEIGVRYHWDAMIEKAVKLLKAHPDIPLSDALLLKCAPFWRKA